MDLATDSLVLVALMGAVYCWLASVQCGLSLLRMLPGSTLTRRSLRLSNPLFEVYNVLLLLTVLSFVAFFDHNLGIILGNVKIFLIVGGAALLIRIVLAFYLYYAKVKTGPSYINMLLALVSFIVPLAIGAAGIELLIGYNFWQTLSSWAMIVSIFIGVLALAFAWVYYQVGLTPQGRIQSISRMLNLLFCLVSVAALYQIVAAEEPHLLDGAFALFTILMALLVVWQALLWLSARDRVMWWYLSLLAVITPVLLAFANRPYLEFPDVELAQAYTTSSSAGWGQVGLEVVFLILIIGFGWLTWQMLHPPRKKPKIKKPKIPKTKVKLPKIGK